MNLETIVLSAIPAEKAKEMIETYISEGQPWAPLYNVLVRFVWTATSHRRQDDDLRIWHRIMRDAQFCAEQNDDPVMAGKIGVLADMLNISIHMSPSTDYPYVLSRAHVQDVLTCICGSTQKSVSREEVHQRLRLQPANLDRVFNMMILAGLLECEKDPAIMTATALGARAYADHHLGS